MPLFIDSPHIRAEHIQGTSDPTAYVLFASLPVLPFPLIVISCPVLSTQRSQDLTSPSSPQSSIAALYTPAVLGMPVAQYASTITKPST